MNSNLPEQLPKDPHKHEYKVEVDPYVDMPWLIRCKTCSKTWKVAMR